MVNELRINGLRELMAALLKLPDELKQEAGVIVHAQAEAMAQAVAAAYPVGGTGNLRRHLRVEIGGDSVSATARVKNTAFHAYLFETGGKGVTRYWKNGKSTGVMPAGKVFVPIAMARRRVMRAALIDLVERAGLKVTPIGI